VRIALCPVSIGEARTFISRHHRHHTAPQSGLFAVAIAVERESNEDDGIVGVAVVGRPVARAYQDGYTAEVTRLCVLEGYRNGCSMLYGACWRAARALGYRRLITYTLASEPGHSLRASGWRVVAERPAKSWAEHSKARPRVDRSPPAQRRLWEQVV
jgi:hypothetical protein